MTTSLIPQPHTNSEDAKRFYAPPHPGDVYDELTNAIKNHIVIDEAPLVSAILWIMMTHFSDVIEVAPLALITAPEKSCGKSQLLTIFELFVANPLSVSNCSPSFIFRMIDKEAPTLLIDEGDTFLKENGELKGIINAGHTRAQAYVGRTESDGKGKLEPVRFNVWCPKAIAGIALERHLPPATLSRCVYIRLRRKTSNEKVARLRHAQRDQFDALARKISELAEAYKEDIKNARPTLPDELSDREQDNWEPLFAIATLGGSEWLERARRAAIELSRQQSEPSSAENELLADIREIFLGKGASKLSTSTIIDELSKNEDAPWSSYNRGKPINPRQLAKLLTAYDPALRPKTVRLSNHSTPKGYDFEQFADAFARYLPQRRNDAQEAIQHNTPDVADVPQRTCNVAGCGPRHSPTSSAASSPSQIQTPEQRTYSDATQKLWDDIEEHHREKTKSKVFDVRPESDY